MAYAEKYKAHLARVDSALQQHAGFALCQEGKVSEAAKYSLFSGGKRIRAVLCMAVCEMLCGDLEIAAQYASAIEMLHCYSLIHDDLPCMDDDDMRRGKPSCHKVYGEATALLAGDALLTASFQVLATAKASAAQNMQAVSLLSEMAGAKGMILGQELDLYYETTRATEQELVRVHRHKTGMLINAAVQLGAIAADTFDDEKAAVEQYAYAIGLAFQVIDDVLDVTASAETLGKPVGSDIASGKSTFVTLKGEAACLALAQELSNQASEILIEKFGEKAQFLAELAQSLVTRTF